MNRHRVCAYAIVAISLTVAVVSPSAGDDGPMCAAARGPGGGACVTRPTTTGLQPNGTPTPPPPPPQSSSVATVLAQGRGKKKKAKTAMINMILGGSIMTAFVVIFTFVNMITVTLGKAFLFTFIAKFLVSVNWKSTSHKKKSSKNDLTVVMT